MPQPDPVLSNKFEIALNLVVELHRDQARKGTAIPYVSHLFAVAGLVLEDGGTEDEAIAALLHDGPEDRGGVDTLNLIRERFGDDVADIVEACSDTFEKKKPPWKARKQAYLDHLETADAATLRVSCADKLHNASAIARDVRNAGDEVWSRFSASRDETLWYYRSLSEIFIRRLPDSMLSRELNRVVAELG